MDNLSPEELGKLLALKGICESFIEKHHISCPESICQTDRVIENAYGFIEEICEVVGYFQEED